MRQRHFNVQVAATGNSSHGLRILRLCLVLLGVLLIFAHGAKAAPGDILFSDDFETGTLANWTVDNSGGGDAGVSTATANSGNYSMFTRWDVVNVTSNTIDTSVPAAELSVWVRRGADAFSENPEANEDLVLEYRDSSNNWVQIENFPGGGTQGEIITRTYTLSAAALHNNFQIRFRQTGGSGGAPANGGIGWDYWHVDDVIVTEVSPPIPGAGFCDDFESGLTRWTVSNGSFAGISSQTSNSPSNSLYTRGGAVSVTSDLVDMNTAAGTVSFWARRGADSFSEDPDTNEDLVAEYYNDSGSWVALETFNGNGSPGQTFTRNYVIPADGLHSNFQLRFRQTGGSGINFDYWHVDDVCIQPAKQLAYYAMDETAWTGVSGEVVDSTGNGNDGTAIGGITTANTTPAIAGDPGTCGYGEIPLNTSTGTQQAVNSGVDVNDIGNVGTISFWYKSNARWNGNNGDRMLFDASTTSGNKYFFLVLRNNSRLRFGLEDSNDNDFTVDSGNNNFNAGVWVHVAVTWDLTADRIEIYINGSLDNSDTFGSTGNLGDLSTIYFGDNRSSYFASGSSPNSANGSIDEVRIYNYVQTQAQVAADMAATHACGATVSSFNINIGGASGSTCVAKSITITALDSIGNTVTGYTGTVDITTSTNHGDWSDPTLPTTLNNGAADDGAASYTFEAADSGVVTLELSNTHADDLTITVVDQSDATTSSTSGIINFRDNAFVITEDPVQVAGRDQAMSVALWRRDTSLVPANCAIATAYDGSKDLDAWLTLDVDDPGGAVPTIGGLSLPTVAPIVDGTSNNLTLTFTNGVANFNLATTDVGKYVLNLRDDTRIFATGVDISGNSNTLTTRPFVLAISNIQQGATSNPEGSAPGDSVFSPTDTDFSASVGAYLHNAAADANDDGVPDAGATLAQVSANGPTVSYAWATTLSAVAPFTPAAGTPGSLTTGGALVPGDFTNGVATPANLRYDRVGSFTLQGVANNFLNTAAVDLTAIVFTSTGARSATNVVGRFIPKFFNVAVTPACGAGPMFSYSGQPYSVTVTACRVGTAPVCNSNASNYHPFGAGSNFSMDTTLSDAGATANFSNNSIAAADYNMGVATNTTITYTFPGKETVPQTLTMRAVDTDGVTSNGATEQTNDIRSGRVVIENAFGSELLDLAMLMTAQYFDNTGNYVTNTDDTCTDVTLAFSNYQGNLTAGDTCVYDVGTPGSRSGDAVACAVAAPVAQQFEEAPGFAGNFNLNLQAPGAGNDGSVDITATVNDWLKYDWDTSTAGDENPTATATFGIFRGNDATIYLREIY
jgi:MSHA biogenesis protein MshQ